ncbi:BA14K family protein [Rhizobiaceae bacterium BDR2-2]|uniref:Lectin-like protein BA14k n=1 Tax=Ectorhizobium quercum TaxID=2965071 RepID=A0AAE3MWH1_9HYPH|nr:BA14K family protein [Ectorhizobium quercum]MCX8996558.1 BA14K family protein [Ectorhizobium quercum]
MNRSIRTAILSLAVGATALSGVSPAFADGWRRHGHPPVERRHDRGEAAALGVIGLATGLIVGSAIANGRQNDAPVYDAYPVDPYRHAPPPPAYYDADRDYYPETPRRYNAQASRVQALEPWSRGWYDYCADRYRSFDPSSGTYVGYDGNRHFCTAG